MNKCSLLATNDKTHSKYSEMYEYFVEMFFLNFHVTVLKTFTTRNPTVAKESRPFLRYGD